MSKSNNIAWAITLLASFGAYIVWKRGRQSNPSSLITNNMKKSYYPEYDYLNVRPLSRGYRNNNPVNIDYNAANKWLGQIGKEPEGRFSQFNDMVHGYRAALVLLRGKGYISGGNNTIRKIITKFAPSNENYTESYIANVSRLTGIDADRVINKNDRDALTAIVYAMSISENGYTVKDDTGQNINIQETYGLPDMDMINLAWEIM